MVYLQKATWRGLYSFGDQVELELSDRVVIIGPNNSGKSNILRILQTLVDSFYHRQRLDYSKIFVSEHSPFLEVFLQFSELETKKMIDFFSFYPDSHNNASEFHEYENYDTLLELFNTVKIRLEWQRQVEGDGSDPYVKMDFPKMGIKFFGKLFGDYCISNSFPKDHVERHYGNEIKFIDLLKKITDKEKAIPIVDEFFNHDFNEIGSVRIMLRDSGDFSDNGRIALTNLFSFLGLSMNSSRDAYFTELLGVIFKKAFQISSGSKGLSTKPLYEIAGKLRTPNAETISMGDDSQISFNTILEQQAFDKTLEFSEHLESDGSNLTQFLFSLKNSPKQNDRTKFKEIQIEFMKLFESDKLSFDVILQYELTGKFRGYSQVETAKPKIPIIMIQDENLQRQFLVDQMGAGLLETIYLLTLAHGVDNSVILLDEPAVNLHPTLMKSIANSLQNPVLKNQFIIITHSPELASYEIFDSKSTIIYVRKKNKKSIIRTLEGDTKKWFEQNRHRLKHQIDTRIFFGKSVLLTEGDSDKNLLEGVANSLEFMDSKVNITQNDVIITHVGGKNNFKKYIDLMKNFDIPYLVLGDLDAKNLFKKTGLLNQQEIIFQDSVVIIENGNLEKLMKDIDLETYSKAEKENGNSKPAVAYVFAEEISKNHSEKLKPIRDLLLKSIELAKGIESSSKI